MANRAVLAQRARSLPAREPDMRAFPAAPITALGFQGRRPRSARLTATQRDSTGRLSAWNRSPYTPRGGWR